MVTRTRRTDTDTHIKQLLIHKLQLLLQFSNAGAFRYSNIRVV